MTRMLAQPRYVLAVPDLERTAAFFRDQLGFTVRLEASDDGHTGLLGLERGTIRLTIDCPMAGHGRQACVALEVDSADSDYQEWRDRVAIDRSPRNEP